MTGQHSALHASEEFDERRSKLAGEEREANHRSLRHVIEDVAETGEQRQVGDGVGPVEAPFVWHPGLYHYGVDVALPEDGASDPHGRVEPPRFQRRDRENGRRFGKPAEATFEDVAIETGQS